MAQVLKEQGIAALDTPAGVELIERQDKRIMLNHHAIEQEALGQTLSAFETRYVSA